MSDMPDSQPRVTFAAGSRAVCVKGSVWLLLDRPLSDALALEAWTLIDGGGTVDQVIGLMLSGGMAAAPDFALASLAADGGVRFVVRGALGATGSDGADFSVSTTGILADETRSGVQHFTLGATGQTVSPSLPVVAGILPADAVAVVLGDAAPTPADKPSTASSSAVAAPSAAAPEVDQSATTEPASAEAASADPADVEPDDVAPADGPAEPATDGQPEQLEPEQAADAAEPVAEAAQPAVEPAAEAIVEPAVASVQPEPVAEPDPETLASIREYERLFGAPEGAAEEPVASTPAASTDSAAEVTPDVASPAEAPAAAVAPVVATPPAAAEIPVAAAGPVEVVSPAVHPAPEAPTTGGFIDALPDFFGPLAGAATSSVSSPPASPPPAVPAPVPAPASYAPTPAPQAQTPSQPQAPAAPVQARTVNRAHLQAAAVPAGPTVWAARCPLGHPSQAFAANCRVCGQPIPAQEPQEIPRPVLGQFLVPGGAPITIDGDMVLGRDPHAPAGGTGPAPRLVVLNDPRMEVSSQHATITLNFWDVCLTDLGSTNGTEIVMPDGRRQRLAQQSPVTIQPGTKVILAEVLELTFEAI